MNESALIVTHYAFIRTQLLFPPRFIPKTTYSISIYFPVVISANIMLDIRGEIAFLYLKVGAIAHNLV